MSLRRRGSASFYAALLPLVSVSLLCSSVSAQPDEFARGRELMLQERYDEACPLVRSSYRDDARRGTLFTLAECERLRGHLTVARGTYLEFMAGRPVKADDRELARQRVARQNITELERRLPAVTIVASELPEDVSVWLDEKPLSADQLGTPQFVEVGRHRVTFRLPGKATSTVELVASAGERRSVKLNFAGDEGKEEAAVNDDPPWMLLAAVTGGVAAAALAVGAVTGGIAISEANTAADNCDGSICRNQEGLDAGNEANSMATVSTVGLSVGGVLAALAGTSAIIAITTTDDAEEPAATVAFNGTGAHLKVTFW